MLTLVYSEKPKFRRGPAPRSIPHPSALAQSSGPNTLQFSSPVWYFKLMMGLLVFVILSFFCISASGQISKLDGQPGDKLPGKILFDKSKLSPHLIDKTRTHTTIVGRFENQADETVFVKGDGQVLKVENTKVNPAEVQPIYTGQLELKVDINGMAELTPSVNPVLNSATKAIEQIEGKELREAIADNVAKLQDRLADLPPQDRDLRAVANEQFERGAADVLQSFINAPEAEREGDLRRIGLLYLRLLDRSKGFGLKANYGPNDNYPPESYARILPLSESVAAVRHSSRVVGTAFHLGNNIMITAQHNLLRNSIGPEVSLDQLDFYFGTKPSTPDPDREVPFGRIIVKGNLTEGEDFAIILVDHVGAPTPVSLNVPPLRISNTAVSQHASVCIMGFRSGGDMTVVDGAHVLFPHEFNEQEYFDLTLRLAGEMELEKWYANSIPVETGLEAERNAELERLEEAHRQLKVKFNASLRPHISPDNESRWTFWSSLVTKPHMPAFGLNSNTFGGHSGGPVLNRHSFTVVGLFCRGMPDDPAPMRAGLERHEEAIPISYIMRAWKKRFPDPSDRHSPENFGFHNINSNPNPL